MRADADGAAMSHCYHELRYLLFEARFDMSAVPRASLCALCYEYARRL